MNTKKANTIAEYIASAPVEGQPSLRTLYSILKSVAPDAEETIKWGNPFFVEPRFLFAFSAHTSHMNFAPYAKAMEVFRNQLKPYKTTKHFLQVPYTDPVPEAIIREIAAYCVESVEQRDDDKFW